MKMDKKNPITFGDASIKIRQFIKDNLYISGGGGIVKQ